jgi:hypothetical protein
LSWGNGLLSGSFMAGALVSFCYVCYVYNSLVNASYPKTHPQNFRSNMKGLKTCHLIDPEEIQMA